MFEATAALTDTPRFRRALLKRGEALALKRKGQRAGSVRTPCTIPYGLAHADTHHSSFSSNLCRYRQHDVLPDAAGDRADRPGDDGASARTDLFGRAIFLRVPAFRSSQIKSKRRTSKNGFDNLRAAFALVRALPLNSG